MARALIQGRLDFWDYNGETFPIERFDSIPEEDFKDMATYLVAHRGLTFREIPSIERYGIYSSEEGVPWVGFGPSRDNIKSINIYLFPSHDLEIREKILGKEVCIK